MSSLKKPCPKKKEEGFSLIEILITVAILALIASVAVPALGGRLMDARVEADKNNLVLLQSTTDMFYRNYGRYPLNPLKPDDLNFYAGDRHHELVSYGYLREMPASPYSVNPGYLLENGKVKSLAE